MLDGRWYNASRHYFRGNMTYETPFLLLYPVSRLLSFIQKERVYAGILFMPHLNPNLELGYGIGTHLFDFGVFVGNEKGKFTSVGCKFTSSCSIDDNLILYVFFLYFLRKSFFLRSRYCICRTRLHNGRRMSNNGKIQHRFSFRSRLVW